MVVAAEEVDLEGEEDSKRDSAPEAGVTWSSPTSGGDRRTNSPSYLFSELSELGGVIVAGWPNLAA